MTSKIINMADKIKDAEDRLLEALLGFDTIADDGFSERVLARIRRGIWLRRLALPVAILVGGAIAARPVLDVVTATSKLVSVAPGSVLDLPATLLPQLQNLPIGVTLAQSVVFAAILLGVGIVGARYLAE